MDNKLIAPDVSVVVAAYNVAPYIERALRSALNQKDVAVEIIVVDDNSNDGTADIAANLNDPRINILRRFSNGGPSIARNEGFAIATAPWVAILDGDDVFAPDRLSRCLQRAREANASIVVDNIEVHREVDGAVYPMFSPCSFNRRATLDLATFIGGNLFLIGKGALGYLKPIFSTALLRQHNLAYDPDIRIGEDYMLMAEALAAGGVCAVEPSLGYHYTVRAGSISHRLIKSDIERIRDGDRKFLARHKLDGTALKAQKLRTFSINEVEKFTELVDAIKRRDLSGALRIILTRPTAVLHLWNPVWVRIRRLCGGKKDK